MMTAPVPPAVEATATTAFASEICLAHIRAAREVVARALSPTPLMSYPLLDQTVGAHLLIKHENHLPTGAFKIRGGLHFMHHFAARPTHNGVISATRGNHGQSIALAAQRHNIPATIIVPFGNNPEKNNAMRAYGARLIEYGRDFDEARLEVARLAEAENLRVIHSVEEPHLITGVGTYALEIIETAAECGERIDAIFVPIGMGSGLCGVISVFRALSPQTKIYGVQAEGAPSHFLSWQAGRLMTTEEARTFADGIATRGPSALALEIVNRGVDEIVLVSDDEIAAAVRLLWRTTHNMAEGAGAAATAAITKMKAQLRGQTIVSILTGGNLDSATLGHIFHPTTNH